MRLTQEELPESSDSTLPLLESRSPQSQTQPQQSQHAQSQQLHSPQIASGTHPQPPTNPSKQDAEKNIRILKRDRIQQPLPQLPPQPTQDDQRELELRLILLRRKLLQQVQGE